MVLAQEMAQCFWQAGKIEGEAAFECSMRLDALAGEEHFLRHVSAERFEEEGGCGQQGGAVNGAGELAGEVDVSGGLGGGEVERATQVGPGGRMKNEAGFIANMDPGHPLLAIAESAAEAEAKSGAHEGEGSAFRGEDESGAQLHDAGSPSVRGAGGGGFPGDADFGEKAAAG